MPRSKLASLKRLSLLLFMGCQIVGTDNTHCMERRLRQGNSMSRAADVREVESGADVI